MRPSLLRARLVALTIVVAPTAEAAQIQLLMPLGRASYQTNEIIDLSAVRSNSRPLAAGQLALSVTGADGSKMNFVFLVGAVPVTGGSARITENLHLNGWLLRPGTYTVDVAADGATATATFTVYRAVRKSTYKTVHWGAPAGDAMLKEGEDGLGFNLLMSSDDLHQEQSIAAGADIMGNCLMGGGHQHDLRPTNDWSDPNVYIGAIQRGIDRAFSLRTMPNAIGAHLHDEPGLTWLKNPHTGALSDQDIAPQRAAYERAFGHEAIWSDRVDVKNFEQYGQWTEQNDFKLGFMDAFWKASEEAIARLKPGFLPVTQSQYAWNALFDGYYFNVARSLPVISGHGGYDNFGLRNLNPSFFLEMAMPRQLDKPDWYMPEWFGGISADEFRLEHNLSFITGIQGMSTSPKIKLDSPSAPAVVECNQLYQRIGTIFTVPEYTSQDVAILYSKSNQYYEKKEDQAGLASVYLATKLLQYPVQIVLEEDVLDGSLAANHRAVILTGLAHLDPPVVAGLEEFVREGGTVLETLECKVPVKGAIRLPVNPDARMHADGDAQQRIADPAKKNAEMFRITTFNHVIDNARDVTAVLKPALLTAGIKPAFVSDVPTIAAGKQVRGEVEYDFAVNFTVSPNDVAAQGGVGVPVPVTAKIALPDDGRPVYDAVTGKIVPLEKGTATVAFGPGQMVAFARTRRAIGGVQVGSPVVSRDYTRDADPLRVEITASLVDTEQKLIAGNAPMEVRVNDPLGAVRYDIFRSAQHGVLQTELPLAANDPAGVWTVTVRELLSGKQETATFGYSPPAQCGALAGKTARAVVFQDDARNIYKFFRDHRSLTIVPGASAADSAAANRLVEILRPYDITAAIENVSEANRARPLTDEQAATWCGHNAAGLLDAVARNNPSLVGYNLPGPTILIGSAADNPLIAFLQLRNVLPYKVTADFPGTGHGLVAWNLMTLGHDIEAVALIGNDPAGIAEAVGTAFQIGVGIEPLTRYVLPSSSTVSVASAPASNSTGSHAP
jgi:hypothetical protein